MLALARLLALSLAVLAVAPAAAAEKIPADDYNKPHDLILAVDVSFSMTQAFSSSITKDKELPASDPAGIRWDGVQFAIDTALRHDRIALVIFRGESLVLTRYLDPSGFVSLDDVRRYGGKTGREALRALIAEIKGGEVKVASSNRDKAANDPTMAQFDYNTLRSLPRPSEDKLVMWDGTSVVLALKKIARDLLPRTGGARRGIVLLFTDGFDTNPFPRPAGEPREEGHEHGEADYAYVQKLLDHREDRKWMAEQVGEWTRAFRDKQVPVFTFGLGEDCHMALLEMISQQSTPADAALPAESKQAPTALVLFDQIRRLAWELRHYWLGTPEAILRGDARVFRTLPMAGWHDMGVLLYAGSPTARDPATVAPRSVAVRAIEGPQEVAALQERASQSHLYYYLAPDSPIKAMLKPDKTRLEFSLPRSERQPHCYVALRTEQPLFEYRQPEPGSARYTPKDAIPFEVDFHPDAAGIFKPEHFQVQVRVQPAAELGRSVRRVPAALRTPLVLTPTLRKAEGRPNQPVFRFEQDVGDPGLVLDPDPHSTGDPDLVGPYTVDVTITGAKGGPFEGYKRDLLRRTFQVKDYPALQTSVENLTLRNAGDKPGLAALPVELDLLTARTDHVATVKARVEQGPSLPGQDPLPATLFRWRQGADQTLGDELRLFGRKGQLFLELPPERWAELVPGEYEGGVATIQAPWASKPLRVTFRVHKTRYKLNVQSPLFDLSQSGAEPLRQTIRAVLVTPLATRESVSLRVEKETSASASVEQATFAAVKGKGEVQLKVQELGRPVFVVGGKFAAAGGPALALTAPKTLPPGRYRRTFWLTGPAVEATPVTVEVVADQPAVVVQGPDRDWIKGPDKTPRPQRELFLLGLAGTHVRRTVAYYSQEGGKTLPAQGALDALLPAAGSDRLAVRVPREAGERLQLDFAVPLEVEEGTYTGRLKLTDSSHQPPREAEMLVHMQVVHHGIATEERGPIQLKFAELCASSASAPITVVTPAEKVPVRWWVEQVAAAELEKEGQPGQTLPEGLLDVKSADGMSLLGQKPKDPLLRDKPLRLTVEARRGQLAPGLYRGKLRFHVREDDPRAEKEPGASHDLEITMLVPGRRIELLAPPDPTCQVGKDAERHVRMSCYGCDPVQGAWQALDDGGNPIGPETPVQRLIKSEPDARISGLMHHTFAFTVRPERAGKNLFRVVCPACCRDNPAENQLTQTAQLNARGMISVRPRFCYPGEAVTVEVLVDPSSVRGGGLELEVVNRQEIDRSAVPLTLTSTGGGRFSARHTFDRVGEYEIRLAPNAPAGLELKPVRVSVSFTLDASSELGTIEYGNGSLASLFGSKQEVSVPGAIRLTNKEGRRCRWKARLRYPLSAAASRDIFTQDPEETTSPRYDESKHLQTRLLAGSEPGSAEDGWVAGGILNDDQTLELAIESQLSEPAQAEVWSGSRNHPTLSSRNGMVVEIFLEWLDDSGQPVEQRTVFVPFVVGTGRGWTMLLLLLLIPAAILLGYLGWRKYRTRQRRRRAAQQIPVDGEHLSIAPQREAASSRKEGSTASGPDDLAPPGTSGPSSGDDLLPDYLR